MNVNLILEIARALLLARWKQTLVAAIGVTFSITMFITLLSFMTGLNQLLDNLILNRTPHVRLYNEIKPSEVLPIHRVKTLAEHYHFVHSVKASTAREEILNSQAILRAIRGDQRVVGVSPKASAQVFFNAGNVDITGVVNGIDVLAEAELYHFGDYVVAGSLLDIHNLPNTIILGKPLAARLMVEPGDLIQLATPEGERYQVKVVGLYQSGLQDFDKTQSFASLATVQKILGKSPSYMTDIQVKLNQLESAPAVALEYQRLFGIEAVDIQTANAQFETGTFIRTLIAYSVGITLLIVAGFGIYNILNMMIYEKMDSIAILKATGFSGRDVRLIFLIIALGIGAFGGTTGLLLGFVLSSVIDQIPFVTEALPTVKTYPINYDPWFYLVGIVFSMVTTYLAGLFPAVKASKVDPVIIIRGK
ncbi:MAG: ABC transporter permease [Cyclobacteriaceae bacterium]|jgi:lipoprotein-releasing system permease protein